jgi:hypothetical protein
LPWLSETDATAGFPICERDDEQELDLETSRVVEVLHDLGMAQSPRWLLGSGFVLREAIVLTAAHNLGVPGQPPGPRGTTVRSLDGLEYPVATVLACNDEIDLAVLVVPKLQAQPAMIGRVDRETWGRVDHVTAAGFPNFKFAKSRPKRKQRQPAQPWGYVSPVEDYIGGELTLKLESGEPAPLVSAAGSPWEGLSGAGVVAGDYLLGIAIEHHPAEGLGSLRFVPFTRIAELPEEEGVLLRVALNIGDPNCLPLVNAPPKDEPNPLVVHDMKEINALVAQGLLTATEASTLRIQAYQKFKGWS